MRSGSERVKCWENPQSHNDWKCMTWNFDNNSNLNHGCFFLFFFFFFFCQKDYFFPTIIVFVAFQVKVRATDITNRGQRRDWRKLTVNQLQIKGGRSNKNITKPPLPSDKKINSDWCLTSVLPSLRPRAWGETKRISNLTCKKWWLKVL